MTAKNVAVNGPAIREIRKCLGLRAETLAQEVGISYSFLASLENGNRNGLAPELFKKLCISLRLEDPRAITRVPDLSALEDAIERLVKAAPELTEVQKSVLAAVFSGHE